MTPEHLMVRTADVVNGNLWRCFPAINVDKVKKIPKDYPGPMGVPITFFDKYDPAQFEIVDMTNHVKLPDGREPYRRCIVRNLHPDLPEVIDLAAWFQLMDVPLDVQFIPRGELPPDAMPIYKNTRGAGP